MKIYQTLALGALAFEGNIRDTATKMNATEMNATEMIATEMIATEMEATKRNATEKLERCVPNHEIKIGSSQLAFSVTKVGSISPMVIWSEFRMGQYRHDDHREDAPHFSFLIP